MNSFKQQYQKFTKNEYHKLRQFLRGYGYYPILPAVESDPSNNKEAVGKHQVFNPQHIPLFGCDIKMSVLMHLNRIGIETCKKKDPINRIIVAWILLTE